MAKLVEHSLSIDDFKKPKVYEDAEAMAVLLTRLLLLEPGTIQSHPDMGVGLISRYRYSVSGTASKLQTDFENQIEKYLPDYFQGARISVTERGQQFVITAEISGKMFGFTFDKETSNLSTKYAKLTDL